MTSESISKGTSSIQTDSESAESTIGINIKTLDSQTFSLRVNRNITVPALKEKIVTAVGVPLEQQRLIYRGKVLKDEQLLSEFHVEDGDTLHLVVRQPIQSQPASSTGATDASRTRGNQANGSGTGVQNNRGQVAHGVLLGTVNVSDRHGEAMLADLSRSIETFLGSLGLVTVEPAGGPGHAPSVSATSSGAGAERSQNTSRTESSYSAPEGFTLPSNNPLLVSTQLPFVRTLNQQVVISDALTTLSEFIDRIELVLQSHSSSPNSSQQHPQAPSLDERGLPTPDFLCFVLERVQQLLRDCAASALLHISTRLRREGSSSDQVVRGQIQAEAMQLGVAMQHLGTMLLELGRTVMTLRMGQSPTESSVNAGPAIYISSTGPNPIMVLPNSLFGMASAPLFSGLSAGTSPGNPLSNINIHLHAGSSAVPGVSSTVGMMNSSEAALDERQSTEQLSTNRNGSSDSSSTRGLPLRTVVTATPTRTVPEATGHVFSVTYPVHIRAQHSIPVHYASPQVSGSTLNLMGQSREQTLAPSPSISVPAIVAQVTARITNALTGNALIQSSSTSLQSNATQDSHSVVGNGEQSSLSNSTAQPFQMDNSIIHTVQSNMQNSSVSSDSQIQNLLSVPQTSHDLSRREDNVSSCPEDLFSGASDVNCDSVNGAVAEILNQSGSLRDCTSDCTVPVKERQQIKDNKLSNIEESSAPSSSKILAYQSACMPSSSSDGESHKRDPESSELQKPLSSKNSMESNMPTPLGLGIGSLQTKKRSKLVKHKGEDDGQAKAPSDENQHSKAHDALPSLPSQSLSACRGNTTGSSSQLPSLISQLVSSMPSGGHDSRTQTDFSGLFTNAIQSTAFSNLLTGVASQSGVSTSDLRSMMERCVQSPAVQNTVNQLVQQVGQSQDTESMQGTEQGRLSFSGLIQQMLPVVSQAFGQASKDPSSIQDMQSEHQPESDEMNILVTKSLYDINYQADLREALEKIEQLGDPKSIFGTMLEVAGRLYGEENNSLFELENDEELANDFIEVLKRDIKRRLDEENPSEDKP